MVCVHAAIPCIWCRRGRCGMNKKQRESKGGGEGKYPYTNDFNTSGGGGGSGGGGS